MPVQLTNFRVLVVGASGGIGAVAADAFEAPVTLLFSVGRYAQVPDAYPGGLEARAAKSEPLGMIASVASFFVSRIDTAVDQLVDERLDEAGGQAEALQAIKGKVAVASARLAYQHFLEVDASDRWLRLSEQGAQPQRLFWASTGTKNQGYSDVLYVDSLIGPVTINTMPFATMDASRDHGAVRPALIEEVEKARATLAASAELGVDLSAVTSELLSSGIRQFADAAGKTLAAVERKRLAFAQ